MIRQYLIPLLVCIFTASAALADGLVWRPVPASELADRRSTVIDSADSEALFREIRLNGRFDFKMEIESYVRIKIFTQRGIDQWKTLEILQDGDLTDYGARVTAPDGTSQEVGKKDFIEKLVLKSKANKVRTKIAVLPKVQIGSVIDFQFRERRATNVPETSNLYFLDFEWHTPIRKSTFFVRLDDDFEKWAAVPINIPPIPLIRVPNVSGSIYSATLENVPPTFAEPNGPPPSISRKRLIVRKVGRKLDPNQPDLWSAFAGNFAGRMEKIKNISRSGEAKRIVKEITGSENSEETKLRLIFDRIHTTIRNWHMDPAFTNEDRKKLPYNDPPTKLLTTKIGHTAEIDDLFAGLALAAGFDVRLGLGSDRRDYLFDGRNFNLLLHMQEIGFYVKLGDRWVFFSPANPALRFGEKYWYFTGSTQMLVGQKEWIAVKIPPISPEDNLTEYLANLRVDDDLTLRGEIEIKWFGIGAVENCCNSKSSEELRRSIEASLRLSNVEINNISFSPRENQSPPAVKAEISVRGAVTRAGNRLFVTPLIFEGTQRPEFVHSNRTQPVYFPNPWIEREQVSMKIPSGFVPVSNLRTRNRDSIENSAYDLESNFDKTSQILTVSRTLRFGNSTTWFPVQSYDSLKQMFDAFRTADESTIVFEPSP